MITASRLAGFFAAHAIWTVSDAGTFSPMLACTTADGKRNMLRLVSNGQESAVVEQGKDMLRLNPMDATDAVLLFDGRIRLGEEKIDAVIIEIRAYFSPDSEAVLAVPYTPKASGKFRVHKPKLLTWNNCDDFDMQAAVQSFFQGVDEHEKGARIWNDARDESK
jgi:hypothetical protein